MTLCARSSQVIIRPVTRIEAVQRGIILPEVAPEMIQRGRVIATGPACCELAVGDEVLFERHGGTLFVADGDTLIRCEEPDVLAVVNRGPGNESVNIWLGLPAVTDDKHRWRLS